MLSKKILRACGGLAVGVALVATGSLAQAETVKIGLPAPVTGPAASIGALMVNGAKGRREHLSKSPNWLNRNSGW